MTTPTIRKTLTATRQAEVEALARDLFVAAVGSMRDFGQVVLPWTFESAEAWLAERDRRRGERK